MQFNLFDNQRELSDMVVNLGYILAAASAIRLGWTPRRGSKWLPDQEAVPRRHTAVVTLLVAAILGVMYVSLRGSEDFSLLVGLTLLFVCCATFGLYRTHYLIKRYGYMVEATGWSGKRIMTTKIGGDALSQEAVNIIENTGRPTDLLVKDAQGDMSLVFTKDSITKVRRRIMIAFIALSVGEPLAIAVAGLLISNIIS
jgi:hypothetical protein